MYSKHAAALQSSESNNPAYIPPSNSPDIMADTLADSTRVRSHRLLEQQQSLARPYDGLGEVLPSKLQPNGPLNFHRRSLGDSGMLAYTERAQQLNQRRYQYNFPQGYAPPSQMKGFGPGMGRKWASLPKLNHRQDGSNTQTQYGNTRASIDFRPQSDIVFREPPSRPNSPVRPASESNGVNLPQVSPRIRIQEYKKYLERTQKAQRTNILNLTEEEEEADIFYEDDFEKEDSGVEPELKDIPETPVESAIKDLNQPNRNIEIVPFPGVSEFNAQPAVMHTSLSKVPKPKPRSKNKEWIHKGQTKTVNVTMNGKHNIKSSIQPSDSENRIETKKFDSYHSNAYDVPKQLNPLLNKPPRFSKQMSESAHFPLSHIEENRLNPVSRSPSPQLDFSEVIVPSFDEPVAVPRVPAPRHPPDFPSGKTIPKHHPASKEIQAPHKISHGSASKKPDQDNKTQEEQKVSKDNTKVLAPKQETSPPKASFVKVEAKPPSVPSIKALHSADDKELSDISITGSRVSSKPAIPLKELKPKKVVAQPVAAQRKVSAKPTPKPAIRQTVHPASKANVSKVPAATESGVIVPEPKKVKSPEPAAKVPEEEEIMEEEDTLTDLKSGIKGVLKGKKGEDGKKAKKKSVQFGPKFVREVTKITYPWNVPSSSSSESDSDEDSDSSDDSDEDGNSIDEAVEDAIEDALEEASKNKSAHEVHAHNVIDIIEKENKTLYGSTDSKDENNGSIVKSDIEVESDTKENNVEQEEEGSGPSKEQKSEVVGDGVSDSSKNTEGDSEEKK